MLAYLLPLVFASAPCEFKEPKAPPQFQISVTHRGPELKHKLDARWFSCAKKTGAELEVTFSVGEGDQLSPVRTKKLTSYSFNESLPLKQACESGPGPKKAQVSLRGKGEFERLSWESPVTDLYCERCEWRGYDNMLALHLSGFTTPKGKYTIEGKVDADWYACAKKGSSLELLLYAAPTRVEAKEMKEPTHRIRGLTGAKFKKSFSRAPFCKGGIQWLGYELHGTGEMQRLNGSRGVRQVYCK